MSIFEGGDTVEASFNTLYSQSKESAESYMHTAVRNIDEQFGEGYAKANPNLVAAFMQTAVTDFTASSTAKVNGAALRVIAESLDRMATGLENIADALASASDA